MVGVLVKVAVGVALGLGVGVGVLVGVDVIGVGADVAGSDVEVGSSSIGVSGAIAVNVAWTFATMAASVAFLSGVAVGGTAAVNVA